MRWCGFKQRRGGRERRGEPRACTSPVRRLVRASCSLPFELPLCPLRGTPPALRVWSPLPSALLFSMPRSEKAHVSQLAARKDLLGSEGSLNWSREIWILVTRAQGRRRHRQTSLVQHLGSAPLAPADLTPLLTCCALSRLPQGRRT